MSEVFTQAIQAARLLFRAGDVVEVRVPKAGRQRTISGYFSDFEKMARSIASLESQKFPGVYWTLNPVKPALLARAANTARPYAEATTSDHEILTRRLLLVDLDPLRPSGISATDPEHDAALLLADRMRAELVDEGWSEPIAADSGNGAHLLFAVDLPNDAESTELLKRVLEALAWRFDTLEVSVDKTTFNASRISKAYGTTARKGDSTADRPHRVSRILHSPAELLPVSCDVLRRTAETAPVKTPPRQQQHTRPFTGPRVEFDLADFLRRFGIAHRNPAAYEGGWKYVLDACPFDPSHKAPDSAVFEGSDGALGFKCLHNSCADRHWRDFREFFEGPRPIRPFPPPRSAPAPRDEDVPPPPARGSAEANESVTSQTSDARDVEIALSASDVEAAIDAAPDLPAAMKLYPDVARLPAESRTLIRAKLRLRFKRDFSAREFDHSIKALIEKQSEPPAPPDDDDPQLGDDAPDLTMQPFTDSGNGERIVLLHGNDIRYCVEFAKWLVWDGRRWKIDEDGSVTQRAKQMARLLHHQAKAVGDEGLRKLLKEHARSSESHAAIVAGLKRAATEPGIAVNAADLDKHRYLLNCLNGVVDLRTGELMPPERRYLITKLCHYNYRAEAQSPRFLKFLNWAMGESDASDSERVVRLVGFLQKALGYSLTGDVSEKAAFVCYGRSGNNGKTTLLTIFTTILTEYSTQLDINTLMTTKMTDNNMRADMAKLAGARLVTTSEVDDQQKLSERLLKYLTAGMGKVVACRKFENPFEFDATHKIWMDCNYRPTVRGGDEAIWGRLMCVPFDQHLDKDDPAMDKKLKDKILAEGEGVLAWAIRGAIQWAKDGYLDHPPEIKEANAKWRDADDPLRDFLEDYCELGDPDEGFWVLGSKLSSAYDQWCKENKERFPLGRGQFSERLELKGFKENRSRRDFRDKQMRTREGLRLREDVTLVSAPGRSQQDKSGI